MNDKSAILTLASITAAVFVFGVQAGAADLAARPYTKAPPMVEPVSNWTGLYVGAHFGGAFSGESVDSAVGGASIDPSGVLGGVQFGYNYQFSPNWLLGFEGELSWSSATGTANLGGATFTSDHNWYDTATGRLGYVQNNWMFFVKGGAAWINADYSVAATGLAAASNVTRDGWTIGAGAEYMIAPNWSAKIEYDYLDFGNSGVNLGPAGANFDTQVQEAKVGLNYYFMPGTLFSRF